VLNTGRIGRWEVVAIDGHDLLKVHLLPNIVINIALLGFFGLIILNKGLELIQVILPEHLFSHLMKLLDQPLRIIIDKLHLLNTAPVILSQQLAHGLLGILIREHSESIWLVQAPIHILKGDGLDHTRVLIVEGCLLVKHGEVLKHYQVGASHTGGETLETGTSVAFLEEDVVVDWQERHQLVKVLEAGFRLKDGLLVGAKEWEVVLVAASAL
jgi:hypothetical protein